MKCLPSPKISQANGIVIHDWHAEILALRALNHYFVSECHRLADNPSETSKILRRRTEEERVPADELHTQQNAWQGQPFAIIEGVTLHMYCSEAPCGDASMELTMAAQVDATPWATSRPSPEQIVADSVDQSDGGTLLGRGHFSQLGVVRRKPARADAPPTMSKSCSDKMALKQCSSVLSALATVFIHPGNAYIQTVVLPVSQYSAAACERSFSASGRMGALTKRTWNGGHAFRPFKVQTTGLEFDFSRRSVQCRSEKIGPSNMAAAWNARGLDEALVNGVISGRRATDARGASSCSRRKMWILALEVASMLESRDADRQLRVSTYGETKTGGCLAARAKVIEMAKVDALSGWVPNRGDESFTVDQQAK